MTEPVYEFIKGQGWVVKTTTGFYAEDIHGTRIWAEYRMPKYGEFYVVVRKRTQDELIKILKNRRYQGWFRRGGHSDSSYTEDYLVLTPV